MYVGRFCHFSKIDLCYVGYMISSQKSTVIMSYVNAKFKFLHTNYLGHIMWGSVDGSRMTKVSLYTKALLHNVGTWDHKIRKTVTAKSTFAVILIVVTDEPVYLSVRNLISCTV